MSEDEAKTALNKAQFAFVTAESTYNSQLTTITREQDIAIQAVQEENATAITIIVNTKQAAVDVLEQQAAIDIAARTKITTENIATKTTEAQDKIAAAALAYREVQQQLTTQVEEAKKVYVDLVKIRESSEAVQKLSELGTAKSTAIQSVRDIMGEKPPADLPGRIAFDAKLRLAQQLEAKAIKIYDETFAKINDDHLVEMVNG